MRLHCLRGSRVSHPRQLIPTKTSWRALLPIRIYHYYRFYGKYHCCISRVGDYNRRPPATRYNWGIAYIRIFCRWLKEPEIRYKTPFFLFALFTLILCFFENMFPPSLSRELNASNDLKRSDPPDTYCQLSRRRRGFHQEGKELGLSNSMSARSCREVLSLPCFPHRVTFYYHIYSLSHSSDPIA